MLHTPGVGLPISIPRTTLNQLGNESTHLSSNYHTINPHSHTLHQPSPDSPTYEHTRLCGGNLLSIGNRTIKLLYTSNSHNNPFMPVDKLEKSNTEIATSEDK